MLQSPFLFKRKALGFKEIHGFEKEGLTKDRLWQVTIILNVG